jgi:hypothetical protein
MRYGPLTAGELKGVNGNASGTIVAPEPVLKTVFRGAGRGCFPTYDSASKRGGISKS